MTSMLHVHALTKELFDLISKPFVKEDRDERINEITSILDKREQLLADVQPPFSQNDEKLFEQIMDWNEKINKTFLTIKRDIQMDLTQVKKSKQSQQQYVNPYANIPTKDGMFYDKRK
ncbi:flagellar protein FliT [Metabacillus halosaccharovorans]|uniref:flagellar protein FliT n=1 Tax=Metabacillus halosaccharovorans TaxID=930124 RepID=UPI002040C848|nr:flagellar protein FliT [Metabacillus halosaccharovorans]MCM3443057.1 flagellar protein FliT [Metabacillus halosaccharovorans]